MIRPPPNMFTTHTSSHHTPLTKVKQKHIIPITNRLHANHIEQLQPTGANKIPVNSSPGRAFNSYDSSSTSEQSVNNIIKIIHCEGSMDDFADLC